jgi:hypothetical protein
MPQVIVKQIKYDLTPVVSHTLPPVSTQALQLGQHRAAVCPGQMAVVKALENGLDSALAALIAG